MVGNAEKAAFGAHNILCVYVCMRICVVQSDERRSCIQVYFLVSIEQFFLVIDVVNISVDSSIHLYLPYQVKRGVNLCDRFIAINFLVIDFRLLCVFQIDKKVEEREEPYSRNVFKLISNKCQSSTVLDILCCTYLLDELKCF